MKWLKKRYRNEVGEFDGVIVKILLGVHKGLNGFAGWLQRKMNRFSLRKQKIVLAFFCLLFAGASLYVAVAGFRQRSYSYHQQSISVTPLLKQQDVHAQISFQELTRIHQFKVHIDSLSGEERRQFLAGRPHLMDTVNFLESLYQKEINTK
jgi:hypothetical protein